MKSLRMSFSQALCLVFLGLMVVGNEHGNASTRTVEAPHFIYEIFTSSFADSNGDGTGDLEGIRQNLGYISSLGADAIWLTPIFESPSYHGYDVSDYYSIKKKYGTLSDFKNLVASAHAKNIKIILDIPVNHTSSKSLWFQDHSNYLWSPKASFLPKQWYPKLGEYYFSSFSPSMPDLNWKNPDVLTRIESVFDYWIALGVDGFRLDAAKFLIKGPNGEQNQPETHAIWQNIKSHVGENTYLVGEVWDSAENIASYYGQGNELDAAFDFPIEGSLRSSITAHTAKDFLDVLNEKLNTQRSPFFAAPFAGNHDVDRLASVLGNDLDAQKLAALAVFTLPGTPTVYYGDEIGMPSGNATQYPGDLAKRTQMDWVSANLQSQKSGSLLLTYQALAKVHSTDEALRDGFLSHIQALGQNGVSFMREDSRTGKKSLVILNFGQSALPEMPITVHVESAQILFGSADLKILGDTQASISNLAAKQGVVFSIK